MVFCAYFTFTRRLPFWGECQIITKYICFVSIALVAIKFYCSCCVHWASLEHLLCCVQTHTQIYALKNALKISQELH